MTTTGACPACGGPWRSELAYPARERGGSLRFERILLCGGCGFGTAAPAVPQDALDAYYGTGTYWASLAMSPGASAATMAHEGNQARHRLQSCLGHLPRSGGLHLLDLGAGRGWTIPWAERLLPGRVAAFDFVEPDDRLAADILARGAPFPLARAVVPLPSGRYRLAFANQVLEHVADPVAFLSALRAALQPDGIAYVEVPFSDYRFKQDVFPHVQFFTPEAMIRIAERSGLRTLRCEGFGRWPGAGGADLARRAAFRAATALGAGRLSRLLDDALWDYGARTDGIWIRWIGARDDA